MFGEVNILQGSPHRLFDLLYRSVDQEFVRRKVEQLASDQRVWNDAPDIIQHGLCFEVAKRVLRSQAPSSLSSKQKQVLVKLLSNKVVTGDVLSNWGYSCDAVCPFCGRHDDVYHRLALCSHSADDRVQLFGSKILRDALEGGRDKLLYNRGWVPPASRHVTSIIPEDFQLEWTFGPNVAHDTSLDPLLSTFGDGSAMRPINATLARAGFSLAQVDDAGQLIRAVRSPVPRSLPQSAAAAERVAVYVANWLMRGITYMPLYCDCTSALALVNDHLKERGPASPWASLARWMWQDGIRLTSARWTKSHHDLSALAGTELFEALGNQLVDRLAKKAATSSLPPKDQVD